MINSIKQMYSLNTVFRRNRCKRKYTASTVKSYCANLRGSPCMCVCMYVCMKSEYLLQACESTACASIPWLDSSPRRRRCPRKVSVLSKQWQSLVYYRTNHFGATSARPSPLPPTPSTPPARTLVVIGTRARSIFVRPSQYPRNSLW